MLVHRVEIPTAELAGFEQAIRASGRDPSSFKAQGYEATLLGQGACLRRVHVVGGNHAAQYEASGGSGWLQNFARHLARGFFG
jgi:hypothetical protein